MVIINALKTMVVRQVINDIPVSGVTWETVGLSVTSIDQTKYEVPNQHVMVANDDTVMTVNLPSGPIAIPKWHCWNGRRQLILSLVKSLMDHGQRISGLLAMRRQLLDIMHPHSGSQQLRSLTTHKIKLLRLTTKPLSNQIMLLSKLSLCSK